jgi:2-oxoglutarate dehydrogenase E1 component
VQDEPLNQGPAPYLQLNAWPEIGADVEQVTRPASSSPAVGTAKRHIEEQKELISRAFA